MSFPPPEGAAIGRGSAQEWYADEQAAGRLPTVAISIKQPWSWLIVNGWKDVENRTWKKVFPERALVHAGQTLDVDAHHALMTGEHPANGEFLPPGLAEAYINAMAANQVRLGGFVGVTNIVACHDMMDETTTFESDWFVGLYGYQLSQARPLPFLPWRGQLGFFQARVEL